MTHDELRAYATTLILDHARDIEWLSIHEMAEDHAPGGEISDEEAEQVSQLITKATITVAFPDTDETTTSNEYEVRYPSGVVIEFNDIGDALDWQASSPPSTELVQRTVTTTVLQGDWTPVANAPTNG